MSVFEDQMEDWLENDCDGNVEDYDGAGNKMFDDDDIGEYVDVDN